MPFRLARELRYDPPPRCPVCDVGILAYGRSEPFAVDDRGVYCRVHGFTVEPTYGAVHEAWRVERQRVREAGLDALARETEGTG